MKRTATRTLWIVLCTLAVFVLPAFADSQVRIVRLSYLNGSVQIDRNTGAGFEKAIMNMPITQGTQLKTEDGQAEVEFENGSTVRLTPETQVVFDGLTLRDDGNKLSSMTLQRGVAYFELNHKDKNEFRIQVAGRDLELKKSAHFRIDTSRDQVRIAVFKGDVSVAGSGKLITVKKNETFTFDPAEQNRYALAKGIDEYQFDSWDKAREQYQDQYARVSYGRGVPYYGWSDLNYYGAFSYVPGWGYMWRPFGVGYGWDPFAVGYWAWYPWGYTWVSPYAWGWTPYRYGGWNYVPGYGWGWMPGSGHHHNWYPTPPVHHGPPGWRPPQPPTGGGAGLVTIGHPHPMPVTPIPKSFAGGTGPGAGLPTRRLHVQPLPTPNVTSGTGAGLDGHANGTGGNGEISPLTPGTISAPGSNGGANSGNNVWRGHNRVFTPPSSTGSGASSGTAAGQSAGSHSSGSSAASGSHSSGSFGGGAGSHSGGSMGGGGSTHGGSGGGGHAGGSTGGRSPR